MKVPERLMKLPERPMKVPERPMKVPGRPMKVPRWPMKVPGRLMKVPRRLIRLAARLPGAGLPRMDGQASPRAPLSNPKRHKTSPNPVLTGRKIPARNWREDQFISNAEDPAKRRAARNKNFHSRNGRHDPVVPARFTTG